jgi:hypothetical protein
MNSLVRVHVTEPFKQFWVSGSVCAAMLWVPLMSCGEERTRHFVGASVRRRDGQF